MASVEEKRQKIAAAEARIARLKFEISKQARADDTRRKILVGSFVMSASTADPLRLANLRMHGKTLDQFLTRPSDRRLFGLPNDMESKDVGDEETT